MFFHAEQNEKIHTQYLILREVPTVKPIIRASHFGMTATHLFNAGSE